MQGSSGVSIIHPRVLESADVRRAEFASAAPFPHVVIDDFLAPDFAAALLDSFPAFERGNAVGDDGRPGGKSTLAKIRQLGPAWQQLDDAIRSPEFLEAVGRLTGIDGLIYDPWYLGGGTHENRNGMSLDPHVDFNYHPSERWHRRLNLIVYLNREWDDAWGGSLELHSDPRSPDDRIEVVTPLFNRCVIFETTESSWHGFSRITLPSDRKDVSRKSVALYFYTTDRPIEELGPTHSTIYIDRPLPPRFAPGLTLSAGDVEELRTLLARRDQHLQRMYADTTRLTAELERLQTAMRRGRLGRLIYMARRLAARLRR